jgi:HK97 family phage portal protein
MGLIQRVKEGFAYMVRGEKAIVGLDAMIGAGGSVAYPKTDFESLSREGYEQNAVVYACITALMDAMEEAPLIVEVRNRKGEWEERPDHSLAQLLSKPNPEMSEDDLQSVTTLYQKLAGNMFWEKERSKAGRVVGLWPMRPDRVGITTVKSKPGERVKQRITGYTWRSGADVLQLPAKDVIHCKEFHPRDDLFGLPPLAAAAREGDTDNKATDYVRSFFDNAAVPKGLLKIAGRIDPAESRRIEELLVDLYTGRGGWHKPLVLGEGSEWLELAESFKDMDFPNLRKVTETRICAIFKVPPVVAQTYAGLEQATYSNYEEAAKRFTRGTMIPMYRRFDTVLTRGLAHEWGYDVRIRSDTSQLASLVEDVNDVWERATAAFTAGAITREMFWDEVGLEPPEEGVFVISPMLMEVAVGQAQKAIQITEHKTIDIHEAQYKVFDAVAKSWERRFKDAAQELFKEELEEIMRILRTDRKQAPAPGVFADFTLHVVAYLVTRTDAWTEMYLGLMGGLMASQVETVGATLGFSFDLAQPTVQAFLHEYTMEFAKGVVGVTETGMRGLVAIAQEEGWSVPHLRNEIMGLFDAYDRDRAEMIARTETIRSSNAGTQEAWRMAGISRKRWYASIDGRQCPWCEQMHNDYGPGTDGISMTQTFVNEGTMLEAGEKTMTVTYTDVYYPPLHPRCRCTILAVVE